jgi:hypothetical protein
MKMRIVFLLCSILLIGSSNFLHGQKLSENEVDEFTGNTVMRTSWETLYASLKFTSYYRVSKINNDYYLDLKIVMNGAVFSIDEGAELMIKLKTSEIISLSNLEFKVTCLGCGAKGLAYSSAQGIQVSYKLSKSQIDELKKGIGTKLRIYTSKGYLEGNIKARNYKKFKNALGLID